MEDEIAECGNDFDCPEEFNEGGKSSEANLAVEVSTEVREEALRERL